VNFRQNRDIYLLYLILRLKNLPYIIQRRQELIELLLLLVLLLLLYISEYRQGPD
jgi:hypothetical protein